VSATTSGPSGRSADDAGAPPPIGAAVRLSAPLPYLKTADPMPMLRPPDLIDPAEVGVVVECRPLAMLAVRFRRGTFLLSSEVLSLASPPQDPG
jgi:hypothetical protein